MADTPKLNVLRGLTFGQQVAEDEGAELTKYFVETADWRRLFAGDVDVIYGQKGAGKSALYSLLLKRAADLKARDIGVMPAENVRGATAFQELAADPPPTEHEFTALWKMYLLSLVGDSLDNERFNDPDAKTVISALKANGLMREHRSLTSLLRTVADYVKGLLRAKSVEAGVSIDPHTGLPVGFTGKIVMKEPSREEETVQGMIGIASLFDAASRSLATKGRVAWILVDRLDVAFAENSALEENALRALFKTYLDLLRNENIRLKIFLRSDIWKRITASGFREASHITRQLTIAWDPPSLLDLIIRRALQNDALRDLYCAKTNEVLSSATERMALFKRMFYERADPGTRKPKTLDWIITRTRDGTQVSAPREVVHLLNEAVAIQVRKLDLGDEEPDEEFLFSRGALKEALPKVSKVRFEQTIYAEYPALKQAIEALRDEKSLQSPPSLAKIWDVEEDKAITTAAELVEVGVFERRGTKREPQYWIPFLYRGYLNISQGTADDSDDE